jgi:hypothetical protein
MYRRISLILLIFIFNVNLFGSGYMQENNLKKQSVVCIHGFLRSKINMILVAKSFRKKGYNVLNFSYPSRSGKIENHAKKLVDELILISKKNPNQKISFVTHSLGGLILRKALNHPNCPIEAKIGRAVLLSPPNKGAIIARKLKKIKLARLIFGKNAGFELMNYENFDHLGEFPKDLDVLIIAGGSGFNPLIPTKNDGKVAVTETYLNTSHKHITLKTGHALISFRKNVIKHAISFINQY